MLLGVVLLADLAESPTGAGLPSAFVLSFESEGVLEDLEDLLGVPFFVRDPPKRSDSISSRPCNRKIFADVVSICFISI